MRPVNSTATRGRRQTDRRLIQRAIYQQLPPSPPSRPSLSSDRKRSQTWKGQLRREARGEEEEGEKRTITRAGVEANTDPVEYIIDISIGKTEERLKVIQISMIIFHREEQE